MKYFNLRKGDFFSDTTGLLLLNLVSSGLNYIYQIMLAHVLSVESFGTMNTIFSFMLIVAVPGNTITMMAARILAIYKDNNMYNASKKFVNRLTLQVSVLGILFCVVGVLLKNELSAFLKLEEGYLILLTVGICALSYFHPLYSGCISGLKKFIPLGLYSLLIPVYKIIGLIVATIAKGEPQRLLVCLFAFIPGSLITAVIGYYYTQKKIPVCKSIQAEGNIEVRQQWINSLIINICLAVYVNIDILAVRYIGGLELSGLYSSVTLFGRIIYYVSTSIGTVLLPVVATQGKLEAFKILQKILGVVSCLSVIGLVALNILKAPLINLIYGTAYEKSVEYVVYVSIISLAIGLLTVMVNFFVGIDFVKEPRNVLILLTIIISVVTLNAKNVKHALLTIGICGIICVLIMFYMYSNKMREISNNEKL